MKETISKYWVQWVCGAVSAYLLAAWRKLRKRQKATDKGIQALLRDRIVQAYYHYAERGWITLHGLENVNALFEEYSNLGGNGTIKKLVEDLNKLDVREREVV